MASEKDEKGKAGAEAAPKPPEPKPTPPTPPAPPVPEFLDVDIQGGNGNYRLIIRVTSDQKRGISTDILITIGDQEPVVKKTAQNGLLVHTVEPFEQKTCDCLVQVVENAGLEFSDTLDGPEQPEEEREKPKPVKGLGFLGNIRKVLNHNIEPEE